MTAQEPDVLINEHAVNLHGLRPYYVGNSSIRGEPYACYPVPPAFPASGLRHCTSLWRGYVATFRLCRDGRLNLVRYDFPYKETTAFQLVNEFIPGDFKMVLRPFFGGPKTEIPFRDGKIVDDLAQWIVEDPRLTGTVERVVKAFGNPVGLVIYIDFQAFMPPVADSGTPTRRSRRTRRPTGRVAHRAVPGQKRARRAGAIRRLNGRRRCAYPGSCPFRTKPLHCLHICKCRPFAHTREAPARG